MRLWLHRACIAAIILSMAFTSWFGFVSAGGYTWNEGWGQFVAACLGALSGALISGFAPLLWWLTGMAKRHQAKVLAWSFFSGAILFSVLDAGSNTGALFTMREYSILKSTHQTKIAGNAESKVALIKSQIEKLKSEAAFQGEYAAPESYDAKIFALKQKVDRGANIWQRTKECQDTTLPVSSELCAAIGSALADKANAVRRMAIIKEIGAKQDELRVAMTEVRETPREKAPIIVLVERFGQLFSFGEDPTDFFKRLIHLILSALLGMALTIASSFAAYGGTWLDGLDEENNPGHNVSRKAIPSRWGEETANTPHPLAGVDAPEHREQRMRSYRKITTVEDQLDDGLERLAADIANAHSALSRRAARA